VKFFIDGTVEGGTAWLEQPDCHGHSNNSFWLDPQEYTQAVRHPSWLSSGGRTIINGTYLSDHSNGGLPMSGLEASLVLIGVSIGVMALLAGGAWFALLLLDRSETRGHPPRGLAHR